MSDPQFIPSGKPHSVEVAEGSHVAQSKSGVVGTEVRQNIADRFAPGQEIEVDAHHIVLTASAGTPDHLVKVPRTDTIERASQPLPAASGNRSPRTGGKTTRARPVYDVEVQEMDFPARLIHLKEENDAVRAQLEDLQSRMSDDTKDSQ